MIAAYVAAGTAAIALIVTAVSYNRFVEQRNLVRESWADIDTELRRRYDLIPNLVSTVKGYAAHERQLFESLAAARAAAVASQGAPDEQSATENTLVGALRRVLAIVERYPDLKASQGFLALQHQLEETEDRIQAARRFYNANVRDFNRRIQSFPSALVARLGGFIEAPYFEVDPAIRTAGAPSVEAPGTPA